MKPLSPFGFERLKNFFLPLTGGFSVGYPSQTRRTTLFEICLLTQNPKAELKEEEERTWGRLRLVLLGFRAGHVFELKQNKGSKTLLSCALMMSSGMNGRSLMLCSLSLKWILYIYNLLSLTVRVETWTRKLRGGPTCELNFLLRFCFTCLIKLSDS